MKNRALTVQHFGACPVPVKGCWTCPLAFQFFTWAGTCFSHHPTMNNTSHLENLIAAELRKRFAQGHCILKLDHIRNRNLFQRGCPHVIWTSREGDQPELRWFTVVLLKPELVILCNTQPLPEYAVSKFWPEIVSKTRQEFELGFHGSEVTPEKAQDLSDDMGWFLESVAPPFRMPEDRDSAFEFLSGDYGFEEEPNWPHRAWSKKAREYWEAKFGKLPKTIHP